MMLQSGCARGGLLSRRLLEKQKLQPMGYLYTSLCESFCSTVIQIAGRAIIGRRQYGVQHLATAMAMSPTGFYWSSAIICYLHFHKLSCPTNKRLVWCAEMLLRCADAVLCCACVQDSSKLAQFVFLDSLAGWFLGTMKIRAATVSRIRLSKHTMSKNPKLSRKLPGPRKHPPLRPPIKRHPKTSVLTTSVQADDDFAAMFRLRDLKKGRRISRCEIRNLIR